MPLPRSSRWLPFGLGGLLLASVAVLSFLSGRAWLDAGEPAQADPPPPPADQRAQIEADQRGHDDEFRKDKFTGVINGISIVDDPLNIETRCTALGVPQESVKSETALGTVLDINPKYLPESEENPQGAWATKCAGELQAYAETYLYTPNGFAKGTIDIFRFKGEHAVYTLTSVGRVKEIDVRGKNGILIEPVGLELIGQGLIVIAEDFGVTVIETEGVPATELMKIADGL